VRAIRETNGVVIDVGTACGYVTGFSLTLSNIPTPAPYIRLGIYEDDHGPTNLIAQTAESQAQEQNDLQVQNQYRDAMVGCGRHSYWLFLAAYSASPAVSVIQLKASSTSKTDWASTLESFGTMKSYVQTGLPSPAGAPTISPGSRPPVAFHVWIAQVP